MPRTKSAKKKLRKDEKRRKINLSWEKAYKQAIRKAKKTKTEEALKEVYSKIDRAVKKHVIHKNKGARLKSKVAKLLKMK